MKIGVSPFHQARICDVFSDPRIDSDVSIISGKCQFRDSLMTNMRETNDWLLVAEKGDIVGKSVDDSLAI